ncbi:MAG: L-2-amino-thiazoline-4-carboxylic acid hydrolase [Deltaproteobacteria bacterium]|nr:L-2-amino-thiazoline-4-carboxylic acid hydrolase [Deltaproteobacteria bacterium]
MAEYRQPQSHMEVEGLLCKKFYEKYGDKALPVIRDVFQQWGEVQGKKMKKKLGDMDFKTAVLTYVDPATKREPKAEIIEAKDDRVEIKVYACPYILDGHGRDLCEAMMAMDSEIIRAIVPGRIELELRSTLAAGDPCCHAVFARLNP